MLRPYSNVSQLPREDNLEVPVRPWVGGSPEIRDRRSSTASFDSAGLDSAGLDSAGDSASRSIHVVKALPSTQQRRKRASWTRHKWWLLFTNTLMFFYSMIMVVAATLTYLNLWYYSRVATVSERIIIELILAAGCVCLATSLIGFAGIMLNNRSALTIYNALMWPCMALIASIGYVAYRKALPSRPGVLYQRLSQAWHEFFDPSERKVIQAYLHCCGLKSFNDYPEPSNKCFPRTLLPGCQHKFHDIIAKGLQIVYVGAFCLIPIHLFALISALMCANHIDRRFGKGLPPKMYRVENLGLVAGTPPMGTGTPMDSSMSLAHYS